MTDAVTPPTSIDTGELLQRSLSVIVGTRDADNRPHLVRALGYRVHPSGVPTRGLTVFLDMVGAAQVIANARENGHVAVVFSQPTTHRSVQFKSASARIEPQQPGDHEQVRGYIERMLNEICSMGYPRELIAAMFNHNPDKLINLVFVSEQVFEQTPGMQAGQLIHG